ncbi:MAG: hypothetical protein EG826_11295 [Deltaproteobacteria bacterium]|nr:hypothetical protein [Deltaproteobacteria bacterium]
MKIQHSETMVGSDVLRSEKGFILLTAIISCAIIIALGFMVVLLSTEDLRTSVSSLGEKRALAAVESGYHITTQTFDPMAVNFGVPMNTWTNVDATYAPGSRYRIENITLSPFAALPPPGYSMESSQGWGMARYDLAVSGENTTYKTEERVGIGVAYGPISLSLVYK